ncbi:beta-1,4-galactosyltransferase galt-1-like [Tiliqua scincoides]|uniref:beta-1,4-galactosyltransferase galt-1-like n=1 Tax=Tiliqua scincoides TaxID=71010 RepID=UPI0034629F81
MRSWRRKKFLLTVSSLTILTFEMYHWMIQPPVTPKITQPVELCKGKVTNETITVFKHNKILIISAYHDNRQQNVTRVIAIMHHEEAQHLYCWFCCSHEGGLIRKMAAIDIHSDRMGFSFATADIVCTEPEDCSPKYVSIQSASSGSLNDVPRFGIKNRARPNSFTAEFTVCLSVMSGNYSNALQFIQTLEMYKILGVQKVALYVNSCSELMKSILNVYMAEGTVDVIPWPIESFIKTSSFWQDYKGIRSQGKTTVLNDCLYRNMYKSKYVLLNDIDEIILPINHLNWQTMMDSLQGQNPGAGIFLFQNNFFPHTVFSSEPAVNISFWNTVPGVNILQHVYREPNVPGVYSPRKMIVNPRKVIQTSFYSVLKGYGGTVEVPTSVAVVYCCRRQIGKEIPEKYLIRDTTIWRYREPLITNVNKAIKIQFPEKKPDSFWKGFWKKT